MCSGLSLHCIGLDIIQTNNDLFAGSGCCSIVRFEGTAPDAALLDHSLAPQLGPWNVVIPDSPYTSE